MGSNEPSTAEPETYSAAPITNPLYYLNGRQQTYPEVDLESYHRYNILSLPGADALNGANAGDEATLVTTLAADDAEQALILVNNNNNPSTELFNALNPADLDSVPVFLYGSMTRPEIVASIICDKSECRTYEQAVRMMPAWLLDHQITSHVQGSAVVGVQRRTGRRAAGILFFSTTGRERVLIARHKGTMFRERQAKAEIVLGGNSVRIHVLVWAWADDLDGLDTPVKKANCSCM